jgi:hypothetical protein
MRAGRSYAKWNIGQTAVVHSTARGAFAALLGGILPYLGPRYALWLHSQLGPEKCRQTTSAGGFDFFVPSSARGEPGEVYFYFFAHRLSTGLSVVEEKFW